ncbi:MAG: hypothetical protein ACYDHY_17305 [Acidiferrobacterales bacterium]
MKETKSTLPPDTTCPFCKSTLTPGATVCASCGAAWTSRTNGAIAAAGLVGIILLIFAFAGFHSDNTHTWGPSGIFGIVGGGLLWLSGKAASKYEWIRKQ